MITPLQNDASNWQQRAADLNEAARRMWRDSPEQAIERSLEVEALVEQHAIDECERLLLAESFAYRANAMVEMGEVSEGLRLGQSAEKLATKLGSQKVQMHALGSKGRAYMRLSNLPKAQEAIQKQLLIALEINDVNAQKVANLGLGAIHGEGGEYETAVQYLKKCLSLLEPDRPEDHVLILGCYNNLSAIHLYMGESETGLRYALEGLELAQDKDASAYFALLLAVATGYQQLGQFEKALEQYWLGIERFKKSANLYYLSTALFDVSQTYFQMGDFDAAENYVRQALTLATDSKNLFNQAQAHELLSKLAQQRGAFEQALEHHQTFFSIQQSILGDKSKRQQQLLRASYEVEVAQLETDLYRARTQELEEEVQRRTVDLRHALDRERVLGSQLSDALKQSQAANELRSRIINTVSHEFRTPLTIINTTSDLLSVYGASIPKPKQEKLYQRIKQSVDTITDLLEDVVLVESVDAKSLKPAYQPSTFADFMMRLEHHLNDEFVNDARLQIVSQGNPDQSLTTDDALIYQIMYQLVSNGLKFSTAPNPVKVHVSLAEQGLQIQTVDQGIGLLEQDKASLFELFYRGHNIETMPGLGLGLYIASSLAQVMGGSISAESRPMFTVFTLHLPC